MTTPSKPKPLKMIRLVFQCSDTPHNRRVIDEMQSTARAKYVQGSHAAIRREDVKIIEMWTTKQPTP